MAATDLNRDEAALLKALPADGTSSGNGPLQRGLGWDTDRYYAARNALLNRGLVVKGRGRGGSLRRFIPSSSTEKTIAVPADLPPSQIEAVVQGELALYQPLRQVIAGEWSKDRNREPLAVEVTALQGRRTTGGTWSRPDIVAVEVRTFSYVPGQHFEVTTFEVKAANAINVQGVYEALAHRRAATRSYLLLHVPSDQSTELEAVVADVAEVARGHGIGVVTVGDPADYQSWEEREEAKRTEPDPERLDSFIATQLSDGTQQRILKRLR